MTRTWFSAAAAKDDPEAADIAIYDEIGFWGVRAKDFRDALASLGDVKTINLRINSPGGEVFDGIAVANMLARHPAEIVVTIDGIAASIASVIAMAGDRVQMPENALMFIHDPSGGVWGTADDMREWAEALDKMAAACVSTYAAKTGLDHDEIRALLKAETWLTAAEAKEKGFADTVLPPRRMQAKFDIARSLRAAPEAVAKLFEPPRAEGEDDPPGQAAEGAEDDAGAAGDDGADRAGETGDQSAADVAAVTETATAAERHRASAIAELCQLAGHPGKAGGYIAEGKTEREVRAELLQMPRGRRGGAANDEISARHSGGADIDPTALWDKVRAKRQGGI